MMRSFTPFDLIQLPRLDAEETLALGRALVTEAKAAGPLAAALGEALDALDLASDALADALLRRRRAADDRVDPEAARSADAALDNAWGALRDLLQARARLDDAEAAAARALAARIFPDGLTFLNKPYRAEWADSETRLALIEREGLEPGLDALGGGAFLRALRRAHLAYGEALHVTAPRGPSPEASELRGAFDEAHEALRAYLVQIAASRRPKDPATLALAERLSAPVAHWRASGRATKKGGDVPAEPAPGGEDASAGD